MVANDFYWQCKTQYLSVLGLYIAVFWPTSGLTHVEQPRYRGEIEFIFLPAAGPGATRVPGKVPTATHSALVRTVHSR